MSAPHKRTAPRSPAAPGPLARQKADFTAEGSPPEGRVAAAGPVLPPVSAAASPPAKPTVGDPAPLPGKPTGKSTQGRTIGKRPSGARYP